MHFYAPALSVMKRLLQIIVTRSTLHGVNCEMYAPVQKHPGEREKRIVRVREMQTSRDNARESLGPEIP